MGIHSKNINNISIKISKKEKSLNDYTIKELEKILKRKMRLDKVNLSGLSNKNAQILTKILLDEYSKNKDLALGSIFYLIREEQDEKAQKVLDGTIGIGEREDGYNVLYYHGKELEEILENRQKQRELSIAGKKINIPDSLRDEPYGVSDIFDNIEDVWKSVVYHEVGHLQLKSIERNLESKTLLNLVKLMMDDDNIISQYSRDIKDGPYDERRKLHEAFAEWFALYRMDETRLPENIRNLFEEIDI